jgi:hypothetical protein
MLQCSICQPVTKRLVPGRRRRGIARRRRRRDRRCPCWRISVAGRPSRNPGSADLRGLPSRTEAGPPRTRRGNGHASRRPRGRSPGNRSSATRRERESCHASCRARKPNSTSSHRLGDAARAGAADRDSNVRRSLLERGPRPAGLEAEPMPDRSIKPRRRQGLLQWGTDEPWRGRSVSRSGANARMPRRFAPVLWLAAAPVHSPMRAAHYPGTPVEQLSVCSCGPDGPGPVRRRSLG